MRVLAFTLVILAAAPAFAAEPKTWTTAPVPGTGTAQAVAPADRAGHSTGPDNASPFSGIPSGATATGGQTESVSPAGPAVGTPSVSR